MDGRLGEFICCCNVPVKLTLEQNTLQNCERIRPGLLCSNKYKQPNVRSSMGSRGQRRLVGIMPRI